MAPSLVWIYCEMTGLLATDKLIEIAVIITDDELNIVAEVCFTVHVNILHCTESLPFSYRPSNPIFDDLIGTKLDYPSTQGSDGQDERLVY